MGENKVNHRIIQESCLNAYPISILIPIYNVEKYLRRCLDSLFTQTYANIEYIFIHDCGTDNSFAILLEEIEKHPSRKQDCTIIENTQNMGISTTRNKLIHYAKGTYSLFVDSDDWIEKDSIERFIQEALRTNADIVGANEIEEWLNEHEVKQKKITIHYPTDYNERLAYVFSNECPPVLHKQIVKHSLYLENKIHIPLKLSHGEDFLLCLHIYYYAKVVSSIPMYFYHYNRSNENSLTFHQNQEHNIERIKFIKYMEEFAHEKNITSIVAAAITQRKHIARGLLLLHPQYRNIELASSTFLEANQEWRRYTAFYSKANLVIFWLAEKGFYSLIKLIIK